VALRHAKRWSRRGEEGRVCGCVDNFSLVEGVATPKPSMTRKHLDTRSGGYRRQVDRGVLTILLCYA
jgi:hypothetical protein